MRQGCTVETKQNKLETMDKNNLLQGDRRRRRPLVQRKSILLPRKEVGSGTSVQVSKVN